MSARVVLALGLLLLAGCEHPQLDPYRREGMWRPEGVNAANIAAQVADPRDLVSGRSDDSRRFKTPAAAVTRVWAPPAPATPLSPLALLRGAAGGEGAK